MWQLAFILSTVFVKYLDRRRKPARGNASQAGERFPTWGIPWHGQTQSDKKIEIWSIDLLTFYIEKYLTNFNDVGNLLSVGKCGKVWESVGKYTHIIVALVL